MARLTAPLEQADALEKAVKSALEAEGCVVDYHPVIGAYQPDFLVTGESWPRLIIDVKATSRPLHFASVAQVARYVNAALEAEPGSDVRGVLLSVAPLTAAARDAADKVGVIALTPQDAAVIDDPQMLATGWVRKLEELGLISVTLDMAIRIAEEAMASAARLFASRYGDLVVEEEAAPALAWEAFMQLEKKKARGEEIAKPRALLRAIIEHNVRREIETAMRAMAPGAFAHYRLVQKYRKQLASEKPTQIDRDELAMRLADAESERLGRFLIRVADESAIEGLGDASDPYAKTFDEDFIQMIDGLIQSTGFTAVDRHTWSAFKATALSGAIDWTSYGIEPHTGTQRLHTLFRKVAATISDW